MNNENIAENLLYLRKSEQLTQKGFAEKFHISPQAVSKWEKGRSVPDIDLLMTIAEIYNISVDDILNKRLSVATEKVIEIIPIESSLYNLVKPTETEIPLKKENSLKGLLLLIPFVLLAVIFVIVPIISAFFNSFTSYNLLSPPKLLGLDNYLNLLSKNEIFKIVSQNSANYTYYSVILVVAIAFLLAKLTANAQRTLRLITYITFNIISLLTATGIGFGSFFSNDTYGYLNSFLIMNKLIDKPILWTLDIGLLFPLFLICVIGFGPVFTLLSLGVAKRRGMPQNNTIINKIFLPFSFSKYVYAAIGLQGIISLTGFFGFVNIFGFPTTDYKADSVFSLIRDYGSIRFEIGYASTILIVSLLTFLLQLLKMISVAVIAMFIAKLIYDKIMKNRQANDSKRNSESILSIVISILMLCVGLLCFVPFLFELLSSFKPLNEVFLYPPKFFALRPTLDNFFMLDNLQIGKKLLIMLVYPLLPSIITSAITISASFAFAKYHFKGMKIIYYACFVLCLIIPFSSYPFFILNKYGLLALAFYSVFSSIVPLISIVFFKNRFEQAYRSHQGIKKVIIFGSLSVFTFSYLACFLNPNIYDFNSTPSFSIINFGTQSGSLTNLTVHFSANIVLLFVTLLFFCTAVIFAILSKPKSIKV